MHTGAVLTSCGMEGRDGNDSYVYVLCVFTSSDNSTQLLYDGDVFKLLKWICDRTLVSSSLHKGHTNSCIGTESGYWL